MSTENSTIRVLYLLFILHLGSWTISSVSRFIPSRPSSFHNNLRHLVLIATFIIFSVIIFSVVIFSVIVFSPVSSNMSSTTSATNSTAPSKITPRRSPLNFIHTTLEKSLRKMTMELK